MSAPHLRNHPVWTGDNLDLLRGINSECVDRIYASGNDLTGFVIPKLKPSWKKRTSSTYLVTRACS